MDELVGAIINNDIQMVTCLLDVGTDINKKNQLLRTPLHYAIFYANMDAIKLLLNINNLQIDLTDFQKRTPLHYAAFFKMGDVVQMLLDKDADPNAVDINGYTPLDLAIDVKCKDIIMLLIKRGARF